MPIRHPTVAGLFYPADARTCLQQVRACLDGAVEMDEELLYGGIVPHAGWTFSGPTAARVFLALSQMDAAETIVFFGAVHSWGVNQPSLFGSGSWLTPLGPLAIDEALAQQVLLSDEGLVVDEPQAHAAEHSIEVQLPFVKYLFPDAHILPIAVPPASYAPDVGRAVAQATQSLGRTAWAIGSSDLTHYGPRYGFTPAGVGAEGLAYARRNDRRLLDLVMAMRAADIVPEAQAHHNACGSGAIAATIAFAQELGAHEGLLLHYTTSHDVMPMGSPSDLVGYGAVVFA